MPEVDGPGPVIKPEELHHIEYRPIINPIVFEIDLTNALITNLLLRQLPPQPIHPQLFVSPLAMLREYLPNDLANF